MAEDMPINPQRAKQLTENLTKITSRIKAANKDNRNVTMHPTTQPLTFDKARD
jgi:hypothetical protein